MKVALIVVGLFIGALAADKRPVTVTQRLDALQQQVDSLQAMDELRSKQTGTILKQIDKITPSIPPEYLAARIYSLSSDVDSLQKQVKELQGFKESACPVILSRSNDMQLRLACQ